MSKPDKCIGTIRREDHIEYHYDDRVEFRRFNGRLMKTSKVQNGP